MTSTNRTDSASPEPPSPDAHSAGSPNPGSASPRASRFGRRALLTGGVAGVSLGAGAALGLTGAKLGARRAEAVDPASAQTLASAGADGDLPGFGGEALPCHGTHQAGIVTPPGAHIRFAAYTLRDETDASALQRCFRILTDDIEGLTSGASPLADPEPELASRPARLSITVGVGPRLVDRVDPAKRPNWLAPLPAFSRDQLGQGYDDGDLLLQIQADDQLAVSHAARMLERDLAGFATRAWTQNGFRQARGSDDGTRTMRNLMGQVDGTSNPSPDDADFSSLVWLGPDAGWLQEGSAFVLRRIRMELDTWDMVDRPGRELSIGRTLHDGAPLTGGDEFTPVDFDATNSLGLNVIPAAAHIRRAHSVDPAERIYRRAVNYDDGVEAGLLFACYQRDPLTQFVPIQQRLDELDLLNTWVTHTGSAVFAILPGFDVGGVLGHSLFD